MKIRTLKWMILVMALVFVSGIALIPAKTVSADGEVEIKLGQTIAVDIKSSDIWWFEFKLEQEKMVEISSSGRIYSELSLYKGSTDADSLLNIPYERVDGRNFVMTGCLPAGTYYFKVKALISNSYNDMRVTLKDVTDNTFVAKINASNFPDPKFREYVDEYLDLRNDGKLSRDEIKQTKAVKCPNMGITDLKGIELFTEAITLSCYDNSIGSLDISKNTKIKNLYCSGNKLKSINVSKCPDLTSLNCNGNKELTSLDLSNNKELGSLACYSCGIKALDVSGLSKLRELNCTENPIRSITFKDNDDLYGIYCSQTKITSLDVSNCYDLEILQCLSCDRLSLLKLNSRINSLSCTNCVLKDLDISGCGRLYTLHCEGNNLDTLDITGSYWLISVYDTEKHILDNTESHYETIDSKNCYLSFDKDVTIKTMSEPSDRVVELVANNFPDVNFLSYLKSYDKDHDNWLSKIEIAGIMGLYIDGRNIDTLEGIEYLTDLVVISCSTNNLTKLDISANTKLESLYCNKNKLTKLNLSKNTKLTTLLCGDNELTSLDLKNNKSLTYLECENNKIKSLDLSKNTRLECVICPDNNLTKLNLGSITKLKCMVCFHNNLNEINIMNCPDLIKLYKEGKKTTSSGSVIYTYDEVSGLSGYSQVNECLGFDTKANLVTSASIKLDKKTANVTCGKTTTLKATLNCEGTVTWKSSDSKIATVDSKGKITGKQAGKVAITATAFGKSAKCTVTVLYKDVTKSSDFWYAPTNYLTGKGVVKGYANQTEFRPANNCTRAQMVTFLYRLQGEPKTKSDKCQFDDVKSTDYFFKPVIWAVEKGITTGVSKTKFAPQKVCTRAQTVTFLWRMAGKPEPGKNAKNFPDVKQKDYFYKATLWASDKKILAGLPDGTFNPQGKCLRRQMVTFLYKYDKFVNGKG